TFFYCAKYFIINVACRLLLVARSWLLGNSRLFSIQQFNNSTIQQFIDYSNATHFYQFQCEASTEAMLALIMLSRCLKS
ncbi:MAG: hypothetical protein J6V62_04150, partial [Paludibacteraceae bacterium]|nr:hypothetical protein [Paludibacteraceae bacterium]